MEIMSDPPYKERASLLLSEKANQLGHASIGVRGRSWTNGFLVLSALLACVAGSTGLADLISKTWVSVIALAASLSTTVVILLLTTLKYDAHLRAQTKYQDLYLRTVGCDIEAYEGNVLFDTLWEDFRRVVEEVNQERASLTPRQVNKFENKAKELLPDIDYRQRAKILSEPIPDIGDPSVLGEYEY
jgi:hypothetical protein